MSDIQLFSFEDFPVRTVPVDGEPWFVAKDVTDILGYTNGAKAVRDHVLPDQTNRTSRSVASELGQVGGHLPTLVSEAGLYRLIMRSNVPGAQRFQAWVTDEVLPTIRKTGGAYIAPGSQAEVDLTNPDTALDKLAEVIQIAREARAKAKELETKVALDAPKVAAAEDFFGSEGLTGLRESARAFGCRERVFISLLREWGWIEQNSTVATAYATTQQGYAKNLMFYYPGGQKLNAKLTRKGMERATYKLYAESEK